MPVGPGPHSWAWTKGLPPPPISSSSSSLRKTPTQRHCSSLTVVPQAQICPCPPRSVRPRPSAASTSRVRSVRARVCRGTATARCGSPSGRPLTGRGRSGPLTPASTASMGPSKRPWQPACGPRRTGRYPSLRRRSSPVTGGESTTTRIRGVGRRRGSRRASVGRSDSRAASWATTRPRSRPWSTGQLWSSSTTHSTTNLTTPAQTPTHPPPHPPLPSVCKPTSTKSSRSSASRGHSSSE
mmetsp:Transcript_34329/g.85055  ORF Transcript_34329/g.85055 Transcript_34329/m.85055 type:complete len:240 (+) Transcript_34329:652-1371(+)